MNDQFVKDVEIAVSEYNKEYLVKHPHDWDCCGFANITAEFGRKTKLKNQILDLGFEVSFKSGTTSYLTPTFNIENVGHQSLTYKEDLMSVVKSVIKKYIDQDIIRVSSYMD